MRVLKAHGFGNLITYTSGDVDLRNPDQVKWLFSARTPEYVVLCAAKVGGIAANVAQPVEFMQDNLRIQLNVMEMAAQFGAKKLLFLGSACAYPKFAHNPVREHALLSGFLEPSNECYALAKICGLRLCRAYREEYNKDFISAMPTNLYGIGDHYDLENSHVVPGMIRRLHEARERGADEVALWGSGDPTREFLFSDDLAEACLHLLQNYSEPDTINIGSGTAMPLRVVAAQVARVVGFYGKIRWDTSRPDGTPWRQLDSTKIFNLGWTPKVAFEDGLKRAYKDFLCRQHS